MTDQDQPNEFEMNEDIQEIKEAAEHFNRVLNEKAGKQAQKQVEAMTDNDLRQTILNRSGDVFGNVCNKAVEIIAAAKMLGADPDRVDFILRQHAEFQIDVLDALGVGMPGDRNSAVEMLVSVERDALKQFIDDHSNGQHPGCFLDEYQKRNSWDEVFEEVNHVEQ